VRVTRTVPLKLVERIVIAIALLFVVWSVWLAPRARPIVPLGAAIPAAPGFAPGAVYSTTPPEQVPAGVPIYGSWFGGRNESRGTMATPWYAAPPRVLVYVSGYPTSPGMSLTLEVRDANGTRSIPVTSRNPGEAWYPAAVNVPQSPGATFRVVAVDGSTSYWLGFSLPCPAPNPVLDAFQKIARVVGTVALAACILLLPGLALSRRIPFFADGAFVVLPGLVVATATVVWWRYPPSPLTHLVLGILALIGLGAALLGGLRSAVTARVDRPSRLLLAPAVVAALGILPLLALVLRRAVDVPYWDEWGWAYLIYAAHTNTLGWSQLWAIHNEHRMLVPNLLVVGLDALRGWSVVREQVVSLLLLALTQLLIWVMIRRTVPAARIGLTFLVATILLLGLSQWENLSWGFQMAWFLCDLGLVVAIWALSRPHRTVRDVAIAVLAATVASLSSSQGLVVWASGLVVIVLAARRVIPTAVGWILAAIVVALVVHPGSPQDAAVGHVGFAHVGLLVRYAVVYLGAPLAASFGIEASMAAGVVWCLWLAALAAAAWRGSLALRVRLAPWLAIATYPLLCALVTASGRAGFGLGQAEASRYTSIAALGWISVVAATSVAIPRGSRSVLFAGLPAALVVMAASLTQSYSGNEQWHAISVHLRAARAMLAVGDRRALPLLYPDVISEEGLLRELAQIRDGLFSER
jgi:hypothetical protein